MSEALSGNGLNDEPMYGIFDVENELWVGNDHGPILMDDLGLAIIAAKIFQKKAFGERCYRAAPYPDGI